MDRLQDARLRAGHSQSLCRCYFADVYLEDFVEYICSVGSGRIDAQAHRVEAVSANFSGPCASRALAPSYCK